MQVPGCCVVVAVAAAVTVTLGQSPHNRGLRVEKGFRKIKMNLKKQTNCKN